MRVRNIVSYAICRRFRCASLRSPQNFEQLTIQRPTILAKTDCVCSSVLSLLKSLPPLIGKMKLLVLLATLLGAAFCAQASEEITIANFKAGILAKEQTPNDEALKSIVVFSKSSHVLQGDASGRLYVSFNVQKKAGGAAVQPEQAFITLEHVETGKDAVFIAEKTGDKLVLDLALKSSLKKLNLDGKFKLSLIVGGSTIKTPVNWHFADATLELPTSPVIIPKSQEILYDALPEIKHMFRQPEKRPSAVISDAFTLLCLAPLGFLLLAWLKIGINFNNAPLSIWTPLFHIGLAGIFALYFVFWLQLNMFETLKYLAILGFVTFLAGNRVLRAIADQRKSKAE
ncbi:unnamed protein product [Caenorhabditis auriculariae]|uniref:Dolichyl-diphosphooligosaccharide--protein glycosyltransferase subunit 2 n=1 Tax=Caenorhabditis auriculariae TaxID=2777116 RepID=A0A8S1GN41_9PELO|nr:unnamed protein product [Caenorhabditis auriculariae]